MFVGRRRWTGVASEAVYAHLWGWYKKRRALTRRSFGRLVAAVRGVGCVPNLNKERPPRIGCRLHQSADVLAFKKTAYELPFHILEGRGTDADTRRLTTQWTGSPTSTTAGSIHPKAENLPNAVGLCPDCHRRGPSCWLGVGVGTGRCAAILETREGVVPAASSEARRATRDRHTSGRQPRGDDSTLTRAGRSIRDERLCEQDCYASQDIRPDGRFRNQ